MEKISYIGINDFDENERKMIQEMTEQHMKKIQRDVEDYELIVKLKKHGTIKNKEDKAVKYSMHAKLTSNRTVLNAEYADWDLKRTIHIIFDKLNSEIEHTFNLSQKSWVKKRHRNG